MQGRFMSLFLSKCSRSRTGSHILRSPFGLHSTAVACTYRRSDRRPALLRTGCVFSVFTSTIALILQRCKHLSCIAAVNRSISLVCSKCLLLLRKMIKDAGRNADLLVGTVAASRIIGSNEMEIPR